MPEKLSDATAADIHEESKNFFSITLNFCITYARTYRGKMFVACEQNVRLPMVHDKPCVTRKTTLARDINTASPFLN